MPVSCAPVAPGSAEPESVNNKLRKPTRVLCALLKRLAADMGLIISMQTELYRFTDRAGFLRG